MALTLNPNLKSNIYFKAENMTAADKIAPKKSKVSETKTQEVKIEAKPDSFDKKIDAIEASTGMKSSAQPPKAGGTEVKPPAPATALPQAPIDAKNATPSTAGQIFSKISTSSAIVKGVISGALAGLYYGTFAAGADMIISVTKKVKNKEIKFYQIFNPKKSLSKSGRNLSILVAVGALIGQIAITIAKSKKQTEK